MLVSAEMLLTVPGNDPGKLITSLNKLILKGYQFNTVIRSLNTVFIGINIDFVISKLEAN